ncbi:hypothetical protein BKE38_25010 [Pseudoroseomonas deserti]|uniref:Uncharacterized protein n=1 Tax=Teichococcus deserti TaxID=1817963 RepID=A0A1V2GVX1_9PROT|nr:hypothetical protein [Pseudoroseomonas deserti]ONG46703.1 hypothetical protein BKE38_25010 [Pseudoroseomonas deserti]
METKEQPALAAPDWEALAPWLLDRATAQGRRDGLAGLHDRAPALPGPWPAPPALLQAGLGQCYAAGLRHGQDVRLEQARRRAV